MAQAIAGVPVQMVSGVRVQAKGEAVVTSWQREPPFVCVRMDGMLVMANHQGIASSHGQSDPMMHLMKYPGSVKDPQEKINQFIGNMQNMQAGSYQAVEAQGGIDINNLNRAELVAYIMDEFGIECDDPKLWPATKIRAKIEDERAEVIIAQNARLARVKASEAKDEEAPAPSKTTLRVPNKGQSAGIGA